MPAATNHVITWWDRLTETPVEIPASAFDLEGFRAWFQSETFPEQGQVSFLNGEIHVDMSAEELVSHNQVRRGLYRGWERILDESDAGELILEGMLLVNERAGLASEPDGMLCLRETVLSGRVRFQEVIEESQRYVEVRGTPDAVAEIVSRSSVRKDMVRLMDLYYRAEIPEYWLIDARRGEIDFRIHVRGPDGYVPAEADAEGFVRSEVLGKSFRMTRVRNPIVVWRYVLEWR